MTHPDAPTAATAAPDARVYGERRLVDGLGRGDETAATELVDRYASRAYRIALALTRNAHDADEIVQNAVRTIVRNVDTFRDDAALAASLYRSVAEAAYRTARPTARQSTDIALEDMLPRFHEDGGPAIVDDWSRRLDDPGAGERVRAVVSAAIDELAPDYRAVVVLCDAEGLTVGDTASALGVTVAGVKTRLHHGRLLLRKRLTALMEAVA